MPRYIFQEELHNTMEIIFSLLFAFFLLFLAIVGGRLGRRHRRPENSPPSPPSIPLLGHLHLLKRPVHRTFAALSAREGPILSLRLGSRPALLVSSASAAAECFSRNDITFANRPNFITGEYLGYDYTSLIWASYGPHWRNLRRITATKIFSVARMDTFAQVREEEVGALVKSLEKGSAGGGPAVELRPRLFELTLNVMMRMVTGKRFCREDEGQARQARWFAEIAKESLAVAGDSDLADFFPILRLFRFSGHERRLSKLHKKRDSFLQELVEERRRSAEYHGKNKKNPSSPSSSGNAEEFSGEHKKCLIDVLLSLQASDPEQFTDEVIKGMVSVILLAGSDTTSLTVEWALALLLSNSAALAKATAELDSVVGSSRVVKESDLPHLPYLNSVVKETLRLRPVAPIIPHESSEECTVGGYGVPPGTMLFVNAWAIHRDPEQWLEPEAFRPERWDEAGEEEKRGGGLKSRRYLPFGMGRRSCPGEGVALRMAGLMLGALLQRFEWELAAGEAVDLREGRGLTMPMAAPLKAICKHRQMTVKV